MKCSGTVLSRQLWIVGALCFSSLSIADGATSAITNSLSSAKPSRSAALAPVGVDKVNLASSAKTNTVQGKIIGLQQGAVASQSTGFVEQVHVRVGEMVKQGDLLVTLNQSKANAEKELSEATVNQWQARVTAKQALFQQAQTATKAAISGLTQEGNAGAAVDRSKETIARATVAESVASLQFAEVEKRIANQNLSNKEIRAPFDGVVSARSVNVGNWIDQGAEVVELVNPSHLEVEAHIPSEQALQLKRDQVLNVQIAGALMPATLRAIVPIENPETKTRLARFTIQASNYPHLAVNQTTTLHIPINEEQLLSVHKDAVIRSGNMSLVYKVSEGVAVITPVSLGREIGDRFEVQNGLQNGDMVVVRGNRRLRPGQRVMYPGMIQRREVNTPANF